MHEGIDPGRGASAQKDGFGIGGVPVTSLDEIRNALPDRQRALGLAVGADAVDLAEKPFGPRDDISFVTEGGL